jgi:hypothetical protein
MNSELMLSETHARGQELVGECTRTRCARHLNESTDGFAVQTP